jgi:uncharacterized protein YoxC
MLTITPVWLLVALAIIAAGMFIAYRIGAASTRPRIAELEGRCAVLDEQVRVVERSMPPLQPLQQAMAGLTQQVDEAERARVAAIAGLSERLLTVGQQVGEATKDVQAQAQRITQALSRTQNQGSWGEMQLRRIVEAAGMIEHVHFVEQVTVTDEDGQLRPDMLIDLAPGSAGGRGREGLTRRVPRPGSQRPGGLRPACRRGRGSHHATVQQEVLESRGDARVRDHVPAG